MPGQPVRIKQQLGGKPSYPLLSQCWLWVAQYGPQPTNIPQTWPTWTMWQYTDGVNGPSHIRLMASAIAIGINSTAASNN